MQVASGVKQDDKIILSHTEGKVNTKKRKIPEIKPLGAMPESLNGGCKTSLAYGYYITRTMKSQYQKKKDPRD